MKRIAILIFCLSFAAHSEDSKPVPLSADDEKLAASLVAALANDDFDKREQAQLQLSKLVFSDSRKGAAWVGWLEEIKKQTTDTEVLSRLPSNVVSRFKLCGYYKAIVERGETGLEMQILFDGTYKLFSGWELENKECGSGRYLITDDGRAILKGRMIPVGRRREVEWECKSGYLRNERLYGSVKWDSYDVEGISWTRIPEFPSDVELLKAVTECGTVYDGRTPMAWATICRLPIKSRVALLHAHLEDSDVPISNEYLSHLAVWSAENDLELVFETDKTDETTYAADSKTKDGHSRKQQYLKQLEEVVLQKKKGDVFLRSFVTLSHEMPTMSVTLDMEKRFAESLECMSDNMGKTIFRANINWDTVPALSLVRAIEALVSQPQSAYVEPNDVRCVRKAVALRRYFELRPVDARQIILTELASDKPHFDYTALSILPDKELPELTTTFRSKLTLRNETMGLWNTLACIERYGSADLLPDIKNWYDGHDTGLSAPLLGSVLRFMMKHDREMGLAGVRHALTFRRKTDTKCYETVIPDVLSGDKGEDTKKLLVDVLFDPEDLVAEKAAMMLMQFPDGIDILKNKLADKDNGYSGKFIGYCQSLIEVTERGQKK